METTEINPNPVVNQNPAPVVSQPMQTVMPPQPVNTGMSQDTKTIIVVLLLILVYPIGIILMFVWMKWPWWVKLLVALPTTLVFLALLAIMAVGMLATINPSAQMAKAKDATMRNNAAELLNVTERYYSNNSAYPWGNKVGYKTVDAGAESWMTKLVSEGDTTDVFVSKISGTTKLSLTQGATGVEVCYESVVQKQELCVPDNTIK